MCPLQMVAVLVDGSGDQREACRAGVIQGIAEFPDAGQASWIAARAATNRVAIVLDSRER